MCDTGRQMRICGEARANNPLKRMRYHFGGIVWEQKTTIHPDRCVSFLAFVCCKTGKTNKFSQVQ